MHLLAGTIALRPYVFVFLASFLFISIVNFGVRTTILFAILTYVVALACEWSLGAQRISLRPVPLSRRDARPRDMDLRRAVL